MPHGYRAIADLLADDIQSGRLRAGERLLPQRSFAYELGIAASTAERVYKELRQRGLIIGEVGRGTFVRGSLEPPEASLIDPHMTQVNLEIVFAVLDSHRALLSTSLAQLAQGPDFTEALRPVGAIALVKMREVAASFLTRPDWRPEASQVLFTGNGKQAIAAALSAIAEPGSRVGVEALTYPVVKTLASRMGIELVPLPTDEFGISPDALNNMARLGRLSGVYVQTSLHNPTGVTMPVARRVEIAHVLQRHGLTAIEDGIYHFLVDEPPLAAFAPEHTILIDSLSKRLAPGFALGIIAAPHSQIDNVATAIRRGVWMASGLALSLGAHWMSIPAIAAIVADKVADARARQRIARKALGAFLIGGDERGYHLWLPLPDRWRAESFAAAALRLGIAVTPGSAFSVAAGYAPNGVRLALAAPSRHELRSALERMAELAFGTSDSVCED